MNVCAKIFLGVLLAFLASPSAAWAALSVTASPTSIIVGQSVSVTVSSSGCSIVPITVKFGDGTSTTVLSNTTTTVSHTYTTAGSFTITADGTSALCTPSVVTGPTITVNTGSITSLTASPPSTLVGQSITFTVGGTPAGTGTCSVILNFGDGNSISVSGTFPLTATHAYNSPGSFTATATSGPNCTGSASTVVTIGSPNIAIVSGDNQTGVINTALPNPFVVQVTSGGSPLGNFPVTWQVTSGSGTLSATTTTTGANGQASTTLTLGATPGPVTVTASVAGSSVTFAATAGALTLAIAIVSGDNQSGLITTALPNPLVVRVSANSSPASGTTVTWQTTSGSFSLCATITDSAGEARCRLTLGATPGPVTVTASVAGGGSVSFYVNDTAQTDIPVGLLQEIAQFGELQTTYAEVQATFAYGILDPTPHPPSPPPPVDIYFGVLLPDGVTFLSFVPGPGGTIAFAFGPVPVPFSANVTFARTVIPFSYTFTGTEPVGTYFTYAGLAVAGSDPSQAANQLSVGVQAFRFAP